MLSEQIAALVQYGIDTGLTPECEKIYTTNLLLDLFHEDDYEEPDRIPEQSLEQILKELLDEACRRELIPDSIAYRDLFDTRIMNCLVPRPDQVRRTFWGKIPDFSGGRNELFLSVKSGQRLHSPLSGMQRSKMESTFRIRRH